MSASLDSAGSLDKVLVTQRIVRRTTDSAAKVDNTLANDTQLLWAVAANEVWFFEGFLIVSGANTTHDLKVGWSVPASTTMKWGSFGNANSAFSGYGAQGATVAPIAMLAATDIRLFGTDAVVNGNLIAGVVAVSSTAGNVNLQWAQNTTDAGELKLLANSFLRLTRLA